MYRRFFALIAAGASLASCAQMTRHSNTLLFGTNTSFGISAGTEVANTPGVTVGYKRQEAVVMPLVANTSDNGTTMSPCTQKTPGDDLPEHCLLIGRGKNDNGKMRDTYSVFASFGARFGGGNAADGQNANGQIAQYFATGLAARLLAENGGAAAVALGSAAKESVRVHASHELTEAIMSDEQGKQAHKVQTTIDAAKQMVVVNVSNSDDFKTLLKAIDNAAHTNTRFQDLCASLDKAGACADAIDEAPSLDDLQVDQWRRAAATS